MQVELATPSPTKKRLLDAVNFLIASEHCKQYIAEIRDIVAHWDTKKVIYADDLRALNALIDIGVTSPEAFRRAIQLVEEKRAALPKVRRASYQRDLMQQRRSRMYKAIELRELEAGRRFSQDEKQNLSKEIQARWQRERAAYIVEQGRLDFDGRNEVTRDFWAKVDRTLDANLEVARKRSRLI